MSDATKRTPTTDLTFGIGYYRWGDTKKSLREVYSSSNFVSHEDAGTYVNDPFEGAAPGEYEPFRRQLWFNLSRPSFGLEGVSRKEANAFLVALGLADTVPQKGEEVWTADSVSVEANVVSDAEVSLSVNGPKKAPKEPRTKGAKAQSSAPATKGPLMLPPFEGVDSKALLAVAKAIAKAKVDQFKVEDALAKKIPFQRTHAALVHLVAHGAVTCADNLAILSFLANKASAVPVEVVVLALASIPDRLNPDACGIPGVPHSVLRLVAATYERAPDAFDAATLAPAVRDVVTLVKGTRGAPLSAEEKVVFNRTLAVVVERNCVMWASEHESLTMDVLAQAPHVARAWAERATSVASFGRALLEVLFESRYSMELETVRVALDAGTLDEVARALATGAVALDGMTPATAAAIVAYLEARPEAPEAFLQASCAVRVAKPSAMAGVDGQHRIGDLFLAHAVRTLREETPLGAEDAFVLDRSFAEGTAPIARHLHLGIRALGRERARALVKRLCVRYPPGGVEVAYAAYPDDELAAAIGQKRKLNEAIVAMVKAEA